MGRDVATLPDTGIHSVQRLVTSFMGYRVFVLPVLSFVLDILAIPTSGRNLDGTTPPEVGKTIEGLALQYIPS